MQFRPYHVHGLEPQTVVWPTSVAEAQEAVCQSGNDALVPWGGGTRQHIGHTLERSATAIAMEELSGIVEYRPDDLTVTVAAGTRVEVLEELLAVQGQRLPFEVAQPKLQTIGGIVATRADSLIRAGHGSIRDALLGVDVINGVGELVRAGGRVVKNVAGYDLPKLYCGSYGTLGLIVEATFRTIPLPQTSMMVLLPMNAERNTEDVLDALLSGRLQPSFTFLLDPQAARYALEIPESEPDRQFIVLGLSGMEEDVAWQLANIAEDTIVLPDGPAAAVKAWIRDFAHQEWPLTAAFHIQSSQVGAFSRMVSWTARRTGFEAQVVTDAAAAIMHAHFSPLSEDSDWKLFYADLFDKASRCGGSFIIERMPEELRQENVPVWFPTLPDVRLMKGIKSKLDPQRRFNPGRFVDGI